MPINDRGPIHSGRHKCTSPSLLCCSEAGVAANESSASPGDGAGAATQSFKAHGLCAPGISFQLVSPWISRAPGRIRGSYNPINVAANDKPELRSPSGGLVADALLGCPVL
jgi:hypothetical protein